MMNLNERTIDTLDGETTEGLLLMAVLGQEPLKASALQELRRRKALSAACQDDFADIYMTNLSVVAC